MLQISRPRMRPIHSRNHFNRNKSKQPVRNDMQHINQNQQTQNQHPETQLQDNFQSQSDRHEETQTPFTLTEDEINMYAAMIFGSGNNNAGAVLNMLINRSMNNPNGLYGSVPLGFVPPNIKLENLIAFVREYGQLVERHSHPFAIGYAPLPHTPVISEDVELAFLSIVETANKWIEIQRNIAEETRLFNFKRGTGGNSMPFQRNVRFGHQYGEIETNIGDDNVAFDNQEQGVKQGINK